MEQAASWGGRGDGDIDDGDSFSSGKGGVRGAKVMWKFCQSQMEQDRSQIFQWAMSIDEFSLLIWVFYSKPFQILSNPIHSSQNSRQE